MSEPTGHIGTQYYGCSYRLHLSGENVKFLARFRDGNDHCAMGGSLSLLSDISLFLCFFIFNSLFFYLHSGDRRRAQRERGGGCPWHDVVPFGHGEPARSPRYCGAVRGGGRWPRPWLDPFESARPEKETPGMVSTACCSGTAGIRNPCSTSACRLCSSPKGLACTRPDRSVAG